MKSREVRLARRPHGEPVPEDFELAETDLPEPGEGRLLVRNIFMSVDPYMRGRMSDAPSYVPPYELGKAMYGGAVGEVVGGDEAGTLVVHQLGWRDYAIVDANARAARAPCPTACRQRAARRARDAGPDRVGRRDRHRAGGGGRDRVRLRGGGRGRERRGPDREGARLPRDRQRRLAREGRLRARRARLRRRLLPPRRRPRRAARGGARRHRRLLRQRRRPAARGGHRPPQHPRPDRALRRGLAVQRHRARARPAQPRAARRQARPPARLHHPRPRRPRAGLPRRGRRDDRRWQPEARRDGRRGRHRGRARRRSRPCSAGSTSARSWCEL